MRANNRRDFLKKSVLAGASLFTVPSFLSAIPNSNIELSQVLENTWESKSDTLLNNGLKITGTFLDEISHDIPHQNWGVREWERDFQYMKGMGIDTVILIRSGYRKFITYPSEYLLKKGCYMPSVDLVDMFLNLADKYDMIFYFGLKEWNEIFYGIHEVIDACAFQDGHIDYDELDTFFTINKKLADKYGIQCWTNAETFDRDMPIRFLPIKFDKLRMKLEAAKRAGYDKAITFEFSHFMSPQSAYLQAGHLYDRYKEYFGIK